MTIAGPDLQGLRELVALACRAPSVHNTQPWRWVRDGERLELYADTSRHLAYADPDRADLVMSCGAALHHLTVAAAAAGWRTRIERLPDRADDTHLASVTFEPHTPTDADQALLQALVDRRTDRRRTSSWPVPASRIASLARLAAKHGALAVPAMSDTARLGLLALLDQARRLQEGDEDYLEELNGWTRSGAEDGVPTTSVPVDVVSVAAEPPRDGRFPGGSLADYENPDEEPMDTMLVICTTSDDLESRLRAGEALSDVLLAGTAEGLAMVPLSQATEVEQTRKLVQEDVLHDAARPQIVVRFGWAPVVREPVPATPRRSVDEVFSVADSASR